MNWIRRNIFLIDGLGAFTSAFFLGLILPRVEIEMPERVLILLAIVAMIFGIYSLSCFCLKRKTSSNWLKLIIVANASYCLVTALVVMKYFSDLSLLGAVYFIGEILVIMALCYLETKVLRTPSVAHILQSRHRD